MINPFAKPPTHPATHSAKTAHVDPSSTSMRSAFDRYKSSRPSISQLKSEEPSDDDKNSNEEKDDDEEEDEEEEDGSDDDGDSGTKMKTKFEVDSDGEGDQDDYERGNSEGKGKTKEWRQSVKVSWCLSVRVELPAYLFIGVCLSIYDSLLICLPVRVLVLQWTVCLIIPSSIYLCIYLSI